MKKWMVVIGFILAQWINSLALAEEYKVAYVDVPKAIASADAARQAKELLQKKLESKQKEVDAMESEIKSSREDMEKRKNLMKPELRTDLNNKIQQKYREYQRLVEDNQAEIDRENGNWTKKITDALREVIEEISRENNYTLVVGKGQVLYASSSIDITDQVLTRLNARTKEWF